MPAIFVHGLGQTSEAWNEVISRLPNSRQSICPNLPEFIWGSEASYQNLYRAFAKFCNAMDGRVDLCGLSLGGVLALNYTIDYPEKVNSLVLIAAQYRMPKNLLRFQNIIFRFMPQAMFAQMGFGKRDFLQLCKTMMELDFSTSLPQISCPVLVVCGEKDSTNAKASAQLAQQIKATEYRIIAGTGHEVNMEASEELARIINDFLQVESVHRIRRRIMAVSTIKASFQSDAKTIWDIVTSLENYRWRSDLSCIEVVSEKQFIEYTKDGYATTFTITACEPCRRWEFDMDNSNMQGHWTGLFIERDGQTEIDFTEEVTAKKLYMKPFVKSFLKKQQEQYVADLRRELDK